MRKTVYSVSAALLVIGLWSSSALALDFLGATVPSLSAGEWGLGFDYMFSDMDLGANMVDPDADEDLQMHKARGTLTRGITDRVEAFASVGVGHAAGETVLTNDDDLTWGSTELIWGLGARVLLYECSKARWGAVASFSRFKSEEHDGGDVFKLYEIQVGAGPTMELSDNVAVYGGLFCHLVNGDATDNDTRPALRSDLDEDAFGGFIGAQFIVNEVARLSVELQHTDDAIGVGFSGIWGLK